LRLFDVFVQMRMTITRFTLTATASACSHSRPLIRSDDSTRPSPAVSSDDSKRIRTKQRKQLRIAVPNGANAIIASPLGAMRPHVNLPHCRLDALSLFSVCAISGVAGRVCARAAVAGPQQGKSVGQEKERRTIVRQTGQTGGGQDASALKPMHESVDCHPQLL
jgi:hypothetical protein